MKNLGVSGFLGLVAGLVVCATIAVAEEATVATNESAISWSEEAAPVSDRAFAIGVIAGPRNSNLNWSKSSSAGQFEPQTSIEWGMGISIPLSSQVSISTGVNSLRSLIESSPHFGLRKFYRTPS